MASADYELQVAIYSRLTNYPALNELVGQRVYDMPPSGAALPYVTIGESQSLRADFTCGQAQEVYLTLHAWVVGGYPAAKRIADAVTDALHQYPLTLATNSLVSIEHRQTRHFRDPDGELSHAVIEFVAFIERS